MIPIWDIWVRLFHWSLTFAVFFQLYSGETGNSFIYWHKPVGEMIISLLLFRLVWGVIGSSNARIGTFMHTPRAARKNLADFASGTIKQQRGRSAAGSWAVLLMLGAISIQAITGIFIADQFGFVEGALHHQVGEQAHAVLHRIHMINAGIIEVFILIHVGMIFLYWFYGRKNLLLPMLTGKMTWNSARPPPELFFQSIWVGACAAALIGVGVSWLFATIG